MSEQILYKEEIIKLLDDFNESQLQGLYLALSEPLGMDEEEEAAVDERPLTELTVGEFEKLIYEIVQEAVTETLLDFSMSELGEEDLEFMGDFFGAFQQFLEEGNIVDDDELDGDFDELDEE